MNMSTVALVLGGVLVYWFLVGEVPWILVALGAGLWALVRWGLGYGERKEKYEFFEKRKKTR